MPRKPRLRTRLRDAWRVLRDGLPAPIIPNGIMAPPVLPALVALSKPLPFPTPRFPAPPSVGDCRVTRERPRGRIVETLYQGGGAVAAQQYAYYNPEQPEEWVVFYRGNEACSGKPFEA